MQPCLTPTGQSKYFDAMDPDLTQDLTLEYIERRIQNILPETPRSDNL